MINYKVVTIGREGTTLSALHRKEERTGLTVASPRLPKGGLRHSESIRGLSDSAIGGDS